MQDLKVRLMKHTLWVVAFVLLISLSFRSIFPFLLLGAIALVISSAMMEFYNLVKTKGFKPISSIGLIGGICFLIADFGSVFLRVGDLIPLIVLVLTLYALFAFSILKSINPLLDIPITLFGVIYIAVTVSLIININYFYPIDSQQDGRVWVAYLVIVTKFADMGGYFIGKTLGRRKLAKHISPGKTIEGFIGGLFASIAISCLFRFVEPIFHFPLGITWTEAVALGLLLGFVGQIGDLGESLFKRDAGVKDSNTFEGIGGVLDTIDSLLFTTPLIYFFLKLR